MGKPDLGSDCPEFPLLMFITEATLQQTLPQSEWSSQHQLYPKRGRAAPEPDSFLHL